MSTRKLTVARVRELGRLSLLRPEARALLYATHTFPYTVPRRLRHDVRVQLDMLGDKVTWTEHKRWLSSTFVITGSFLLHLIIHESFEAYNALVNAAADLPVRGDDRDGER